MAYHFNEKFHSIIVMKYEGFVRKAGISTQQFLWGTTSPAQIELKAKKDLIVLLNLFIMKITSCPLFLWLPSFWAELITQQRYFLLNCKMVQMVSQILLSFGPLWHIKSKQTGLNRTPQMKLKTTFC